VGGLVSVAASVPPLLLVPPLLDPPELLVFGAGGGGPAPGGIGFCEGASVGWNAFELDKLFFDAESSSSSDPQATRSMRANPKPEMAAVAARDPRLESDIQKRLSDGRRLTEAGTFRYARTNYANWVMRACGTSSESVKDTPTELGLARPFGLKGPA